MVSQCGQTDTHQVTAQAPVSRECTMDTERFLHFQECRSFCFTTLGTGSLWSNWCTTLNSRENTRTDGPGCLFSTGSRASILPARVLPTSLRPFLSSSPAFLSLPSSWGLEMNGFWRCDGSARLQRCALVVVILNYYIFFYTADVRLMLEPAGGGLQGESRRSSFLPELRCLSARLVVAYAAQRQTRCARLFARPVDGERRWRGAGWVALELLLLPLTIETRRGRA